MDLLHGMPNSYREDVKVARRENRRARLAAVLSEAVPGLDVESSLGMTGPMLRTGEVALLFGVSERCIRNWANSGKLPSVRTLGRHRLFPAKEIAEILRDSRNRDNNSGR